MKKNLSAVQTLSASLPPFDVSFCRLMAQVQVLKPYGASFAALWRVFCRLMLNFEVQYKSLLHFSKGGGVKASPWTAYCCQKALKGTI